MRCALSLFAVLAVLATMPGCRPESSKAPAPVVAQAPRIERVGGAHLPITTREPLAQQFFKQGLRLAYAFDHAEALRAFGEAARLDPDCAMCEWGIAYAVGPNINNPLRPADPRAASHARQAFLKQYGADFISAMPTHLYGPGDNYDLQEGHVAAALQVKIHRAKTSGAPNVGLWGTGTPHREFLYVDDLADALVFMMKHYSAAEHLNVGTGQDVTIRELAELIARVVGYEGGFVYDPTKPDGMPRKVMDKPDCCPGLDGSHVARGWLQAGVSLVCRAPGETRGSGLTPSPGRIRHQPGPG